MNFRSKFAVGARLKRALYQDESGQALFELSISAFLFLLMLFGAVNMSLLAYTNIMLSNAARSAVSYAAAGGGAYNGTALDSGGMLTAAQNDAPSIGSNISFTSGYPSTTCSCSGGGTASCSSLPATGCAVSGSYPITTVTVKIQTDYYSPFALVKFGWGKAKMTLYGFAQQEVLP